MSEETKKAPAIRFQGFTDDWEQRKLGELLTEVKRPIKMKDDECYELVTVKRRNEGIVSRGIFRGKDVLVKSQFQIKTGDYLISKRQVVHGANGIVPSHLNNAIVSNEYLVSIGNKNITTDFLTIISRLPSMYRKFFLSSYGIDIEKLVFNVEDWKKRTIRVPGVSEQNQISIFYKQIDSTIALHLCKQRQLELLKQRLIKEILPQSDSTLPHLRFANFRKPWEQHQLKEVLKVNSGRDYKHLNEGNIPVYGTGGYMLSVDGKLSDVDGIGLGRKGTIDKPQYLKAPFWTVDTLFYLTPSPNYDIYFLYTLIQNVNWKSMDESTGVPSLSKSVIERVTLTFPILEEQQKIGSFFREFDNTISLHQQKIAHLKALKSTILNKMFI